MFNSHCLYNMDERYYKKNAQLRYQLSKELDIYKRNKENSEKKKINPFIIPLFSSVVAISTAMAGFLANGGCGIKAYYIPIQVGLAFILIYLLVRFVVFPIYSWIANGVKSFLPINNDIYKKLSQIEKRKIIAKFDFDITGLIHLSYVIATDVVKDDKLLNEYNRGEALFYIDRSIKKLKSIFVDHVDYIPDIYEYRIRNNMDLLAAAIIALKSNCSKEDSLNPYIHNAITDYNIICKRVNGVYKKKIVSSIDENRIYS